MKSCVVKECIVSSNSYYRTEVPNSKGTQITRRTEARCEHLTVRCKVSMLTLVGRGAEMAGRRSLNCMMFGDG